MSEKNVEKSAAPRRDYSKRTSARLLLSLMAPYKGLLAAIFVASLCDMTGMLFIPTQLSAMVNVAVNTRDMSALMGHGVAMLIAAFVGSGGYLTTVYLTSRLCARAWAATCACASTRRPLAFSASDFNAFGTGSMITRTLSDANVVQQTVERCVLMIFPVPIACAIAVALAFSTDVVMGWVLLVVTLTVHRRLRRRRGQVRAHLHAPPGLHRQHEHAPARGHHRRPRDPRLWQGGARARPPRRDLLGLCEQRHPRELCLCAHGLHHVLLMNAVEAAIMWVGADRVGAHAMQIGSISALVEYAMLIMMFLMMAQFAILQVPRALACLTRAAEVLGVEPEIADDPAPRALAPAEKDAEVARFDHVSMRFSDADEDTLHDLTFSLRRGEVTAIIGNTGSGKSTIARMLLRFNDATGGSLSFGGVDVRRLTQADLRRRIAYVPQKAWALLGHHCREPAPWRRRGLGRAPLARARRRAGGLCARAAGRSRDARGPGRHELLRRAAPAPGNRSCARAPR